jgi:hypothetical protein
MDEAVGPAGGIDDAIDPSSVAGGAEPSGSGDVPDSGTVHANSTNASVIKRKTNVNERNFFIYIMYPERGFLLKRLNLTARYSQAG